jgi:hypothetical protein
MHVGIIKFLQHKCTTYIYIYVKIIKNTGYAPGIALDRCSVSGVSHGWLLELLQHEDLVTSLGVKHAFISQIMSITISYMFIIACNLNWH